MTALCFSPFCALFFHHYGYGRIASKCICRQALGFHTHTDTHMCTVDALECHKRNNVIYRVEWSKESLPHVLGSCVAAGRARSRASMCRRFFFWRSRRSYLIKTWVDKLSSEAAVVCRGRQSKMAAAAAAVGS